MFISLFFWLIIVVLTGIVIHVLYFVKRLHSNINDYVHLLPMATWQDRIKKLKETARILENKFRDVDVDDASDINRAKNLILKIMEHQLLHSSISYVLIRGDGAALLSTKDDIDENQGHKVEFMKVMLNANYRPVIINSYYRKRLGVPLTFISTSVQLGRRREWYLLRMNILLS